MNTTTATPAQIDTEIARLQSEIARHRANVDNAHRMIQQLRDGWMLSGGRTPESLTATIDALETGIEQLEDEITPLETEFLRRGGWTRFYMVDNDGGHLHSTTGCRTTYATTPWCWMTDMSGMTREEAVRAAGSHACLACFPEHREFIEAARPGRIETPNQRKTREEREAEAAKRAVKKADRAAKAITKVDGSPLYQFDVPVRTNELVETTYQVKTEIAARRHVAQAAWDLLWYGTSHPYAPAWRRTCVEFTEAIAAKTGEDLAELRATVVKKATAKVRMDGGQPRQVSIFG